MTFKVGDAVVARYANPASIDLSEPSAAAKRPADQRQSYTLQGWSRSPDENAERVDLATSGTATFAGEAVYYAVYGQAGTSLVDVPLAFANIHGADGALEADVEITATYGQTVAAALSAAGKSIPSPQDYADPATGLTYRFLGWYPYSSTSSAGALVYDDGKVGELAVTLSVAGVSASGLTLRAVYAAARAGQHVITFDVDGYKSMCVADDGASPVYTQANGTNTNYSVPAKQETVAGTTFTFSKWFADANGNGVCDAGEPSYQAVLPRAIADATYTADWASKNSDVTLTFYIKYTDGETGAFVGNGVRVITTTTEKTTQEVADSVQEIGDKVGYGGKLYTLLGWSARKTDVEPVYDASNPLPTVTGDDRALSNAYAKTFYGVYQTEDHKVAVTFQDGDSALGTASVSSLLSVNDAFAATGAATPAAKSDSQQFLGWAKSAGAANTEVIDGVSATLDEVAGTTADAITLYAAYGEPAVYSVRLRSADYSQILYRISVKHGKTIASALASAGVSVTSPVQTGCYFTGWRTAAGSYFGLDEPVTGTLDLYASFQVIDVASSAQDIGAVVTTNDPRFEKAMALKFTMTSRASADTPLRSYTAKNSYTIMRSYDIRLVMTDESGVESVVTGDFGTAAFTVKVGTKYRNSSVRAFWLGSKNNAEAVMFSDKKSADDNGYISATIGNYLVGDAGEGGNFCIAYIEGEAGNNTLGTGTGSSLGTGGSGLGAGSGLGGGLSTLSSGLQSNGLSSGGSDGLAPASGSGASDSDPSLGGGGPDSASAEGGGAAADGSGGEADAGSDGESFFAGWDGDAVVLMVLCAVALAAMASGLWRLVVVKQRRDEADAELPDLSSRYAQGVNF